MQAMKASPLAFVLLILGLLAVTGTATAAPQGPWELPATDLSAPGQNAGSPQLAIAPDGTVTVVWARLNGSNYIVQAATRPAGAESFGAPVDLSAPGQNAEMQQLAASPDGTVTAIWRRWNGTNWSIQAATRAPGGSFGEPVDLSTPWKDATEPQLAVSPDGTVTVVWCQMDSLWTVQAATRPAGGSFGPPVELSVPGPDTRSAQVAASPDGTVTVLWSRFNGYGFIIQAATRPAGGSFGAPVDLSPANHISLTPQLAASPDGTVTAVWQCLTNLGLVIQEATRPPGGSFETATDLPAPGEEAERPRVAFSPDGTTTVVWGTRLNGIWIVQAATRPPGGSFGASENLSVPDESSYYAKIAASPDGTVTAVWQLSDGGFKSIIQAATRPPGGNFGAPVDLLAVGDNAGEPQLAVASDGIVTIVWTHKSSNRIIQSASTARTESLAVTRVGSGSGKVTSTPEGIDCGSTCEAGFGFGGSVTLTATTDPDSAFTGWSEACSGTDPTCTVTMSEAREVTATFTKIPDPDPDPDPDPKPVVPVNPPNDSTGIYNATTGKLKIRLKCGGQYKPTCLTMNARAVTGKGKRAKAMSSATTAKKVKAGKWKLVTLKIKPPFRQQVQGMGDKTAKTLWVRIKVTWKKKGRKRSKTVHHRYRVLVRG